MGVLYVANIIVVLIVVWAVWERRETFRSRWDRPFTTAILLFGIGITLDSPWPGMAAASYPWTGKYFVLNTIGHVCYLAGCASGTRGVYMRLLPQDRLQKFMRRRIMPVAGLAAAVMLTCVLVSPVTSTMSADHVYLVRPDGWLMAGGVFYVVALLILESVATLGFFRLRRDPDAVGVDVQIWAVVVAVVGIVLVISGYLTGWIDSPGMLVWPFSYVAIGGGAIAGVFMWHHRVAQFGTPLDSPTREDLDGR